VNTILGGQQGDDGRIAQLDRRLQHEAELTAKQAERALGRTETALGIVSGIKYGTTKHDSLFAKITIETEADDVVVYAFNHNTNCVRSPIDDEEVGLDLGLEVGYIAKIVWSWNAVSEEKQSYRILEVVVSAEPFED
jgi:hypothetical protein